MTSLDWMVQEDGNAAIRASRLRDLEGGAGQVACPAPNQGLGGFATWEVR